MMIYWWVGSVYVLASIGLCYIIWRVTAKAPVWLCELVRYSSVVILLTPWFINPDSAYFAPAFIVFLFDLFRGDHDLLYAGLPLGLIILGVWVIILAKFMVRAARIKQPKNPQPH